MDQFSHKKEGQKATEVNTHSHVLAIWKESVRIIFDDIPFSISRLKTNFISTLVSWVGSVEVEECSLVRIFLCIIYGFLGLFSLRA